MVDRRRVPDYGTAATVMRPMLANTPPAVICPGAELVACPWCGSGCWRLPVEPDPLPRGMAAACTACALKRNTHQRDMDRRRAAWEAANGPHALPAWEAVPTPCPQCRAPGAVEILPASPAISDPVGRCGSCLRHWWHHTPGRPA